MSTRASAVRYARALLDVVVSEGDPERVDQELSAVAALVAGTPDLRRAFGSPAVPAAAKRRVLDHLLPQMKLSPALDKLLRLLADRDRLSMLPELAESYRTRLMEYRQVVRAEVTTATPLRPEEAARIEQRLAAATGGRIVMTTRVDPSIIAGAVARIGSVVYDGSVASQLVRIRERLQESR